ncbi:SusE domain-containing protein [Flammeovirga pacifica]|uniref:SusE outer membrane protein domain-containing protein n=1 Tax=Flammeovirga pacifica TaxID=915059 RepID=A0A1S1YVL5_FLAPC|nr:SusE domain-containing protein [Flammeovirga pacifica]OHX65066.1 hypothetical protein NH26_01220 [Flammeovirga pacifica]
MKKFNILLIGFTLIFAMFACSEDPKEPKLGDSSSNVSGEILLPENGSTVQLDTANGGADSVATTFTWSESNYNGISLARNYTVVISDTETFENVQALGDTPSGELPVNTKALNNALVALGLSVDTEHTVYSKVITIVNANVDTLSSGEHTFKVTPYLSVINYPKVFLPGDFSGWNNNDEMYTIASVNFDNNYEGYMPLKTKSDGTAASGQFKFVTIGGDWGSQYGLPNGTGVPATSPASIISKSGNGGNDPDNCEVPTDAGDAPQYRIQATFGADDGSYTITPTVWRIVGDATPNGWPGDAPNDKNDTDMTYDPATNVWMVTVDLTAGELKFRANYDWGLNFGQGDNGSNSLSLGAGNIQVAEAGNYTVKLDLSEAPNWRYELIKN